ncbi:MAG TPA: hypothetical protein VJ508_14045, partial [Saprospiraceae bacterium]|nr:hypothetical protein [Saprospiraceae bacterium]
MKDSVVGNVHLSAGVLYKLVGFVYVVDGATLTIDPGTLIVGDKATKGTLIVERGGRIDAQGTAQKPIVFTSEMDPGQRQTGDWGGIIICGRAPINVNNAGNGGQYVGGDAQIEGGPRSHYGGNIPTDNSGILSYVRIEFPGIALSPNNEINGLTLGGVGNLTTLDHIQVSYSGDDGIEWFGGTVNLKYIVNVRSLDDDWDTDFGWQGKVQFAVSMNDPNVADVSKSNGFEADNNGSGTYLLPRSHGIFSNITLVGPQPDTNAASYNALFGNAMHIRRATLQSIHNSVIVGWPGVLLLDGTAVTTAADNDTIQIRNMIVAGARSGKTYQTNSGNPFNVAAWFNKPAHGNRVYGQPAEAMLEDPFNLTNPNFTPKVGSPAASGASFTSTNLIDQFFTPTTYVGAFDPNAPRWDAGWTNYDPVAAIYTGNLAPVISQVIFPNTNTGKTRDSAVILIRNTGMLPLTITTVNINGSTKFSAQNLSLPLTVAGQSTGLITVRFAPISTGADSALMIITADNNQSIQVFLKGTAVQAVPKLVVFPPNGTVNFGLVASGESVD